MGELEGEGLDFGLGALELGGHLGGVERVFLRLIEEVLNGAGHPICQRRRGVETGQFGG